MIKRPRRLSDISSVKRKTARMINNLRVRTSKTGFKVPRVLIAAAIVLFTTFIVGGGLYDLVENPPTIIGQGGSYVAVRGLNNEQTLIESALSMVFMLFVFAGLLISYRSTQIIYDSKRARTTLVLGIALLLMGLSGDFYLLYLKQYVLRTFGF